MGFSGTKGLPKVCDPHNLLRECLCNAISTPYSSLCVIITRFVCVIDKKERPKDKEQTK